MKSYHSTLQNTHTKTFYSIWNDFHINSTIVYYKEGPSCQSIYKQINIYCYFNENHIYGTSYIWWLYYHCCSFYPILGCKIFHIAIHLDIVHFNSTWNKIQWKLCHFMWLKNETILEIKLCSRVLLVTQFFGNVYCRKFVNSNPFNVVS